ncbi:MAG: HK97 gp10 family phage protein [Sphingobacteriaceae bacterium]|nr:HK97 gp10 family phage protein [Sphingobacteriaceae bacterium]
MKVKGFDAFVRKLKRLPVDVQREIKERIEDTADLIVMDAGNAAPVDLGYLKNSIRSFPEQKGFNYVIQVGADYAAYVEFGTGSKVKVPKEVVDYAAQFKGKGERVVNMPARPFFFPAYFKHRNELIRNIKRVLKENLNR